MTRLTQRLFARRSPEPTCGSCRPKTPEQQSGLALHRTRHLFIRQQTAVIIAIRAHLAEFGIIAPVGRHGVEELLNRAIWRNTLPAVKHAWKSVDKLTSGAFVGMWRERVAHLYSKYMAA